MQSLPIKLPSRPDAMRRPGLAKMLAKIVTPAPVQQVRSGQRDGADRRQQPVSGFGVGQSQPAFVRGEASRQKADARGREEGRDGAPVPLPPAGHGYDRGGERDHQYRCVHPFGDVDPCAERGREEEEERQGKAMDQTGQRQRDSQKVVKARARGMEAHGGKLSREGLAVRNNDTTYHCKPCCESAPCRSCCILAKERGNFALKGRFFDV